MCLNVYLLFFPHFTIIPKDIIYIPENETQITYLLQYGWYYIALATILFHFQHSRAFGYQDTSVFECVSV